MKEGVNRRSDPTRLVRAARELLLRYGYRRTSIDDVAKAANVAKGTVYLAFKSKEALMRSVCVDLCDELISAANKATADIEDPVERACTRLMAKHLRIHEIVSLSPHAAELMASTDEVASDVVCQADARFRRLVAGDLDEAIERGLIDVESFGLEASQAAATLMRIARACSLPDDGAATPPTVAVVKKRLRQTLDIFFAGLAHGERKQPAKMSRS